MIAPFNWLWKQFQGPQITAIANAIYDWMKAQYDTILDYWNTLSIDTANDYHLTTIGALQGVARSLINLPIDDRFWFSDIPEEGTYYPSTPYHTSERGFSAVNSSVGGKLATVSEATGDYDYLPQELFRAMLKSARESTGEQGSLQYIDDILYGWFKLVNPTGTPSYTIQILTSLDVEGGKRSPGDIRINLGTPESWGGYFNYILAELNQLGLTMYYPVPTLFGTANI